MISQLEKIGGVNEATLILINNLIDVMGSPYEYYIIGDGYYNKRNNIPRIVNPDYIIDLSKLKNELNIYLGSVENAINIFEEDLNLISESYEKDIKDLVNKMFKLKVNSYLKLNNLSVKWDNTRLWYINNETLEGLELDKINHEIDKILKTKVVCRGYNLRVFDLLEFE